MPLFFYAFCGATLTFIFLTYNFPMREPRDSRGRLAKIERKEDQDMLTVDKSKFTPEELQQYQALIAKAAVDPEAGEKEMEEEKPPFPPKKKTEKAEVETMEKSASPEITAALERMENLAKSIEMKEMTEIAKKYAPLGEKEDDLAKTLYDMKKSNPDNYNAYIGSPVCSPRSARALPVPPQAAPWRPRSRPRLRTS